MTRRREIHKAQMTRLANLIRASEDAFLPLDGLSVEIVPGTHDGLAHGAEGSDGWVAHYAWAAEGARVRVFAGCDLSHAGVAAGIRRQSLRELEGQAWLYAYLDDCLPEDIAEPVTASAMNSVSAAVAALGRPGLPTRSDFVPRSIANRFRAVVLHEIGHHRLAQLLGEEPILGWDCHLATRLAFDGVVPPTLYAAQDPGEWFAEAYALWRLGYAMPPGNAETASWAVTAIRSKLG